MAKDLAVTTDTAHTSIPAVLLWIEFTLNDKVASRSNWVDIATLVGFLLAYVIIGAAINYLVIRTRNQPQQYKTEEWWRLQQTIAKLMQAYAD